MAKRTQLLAEVQQAVQAGGVAAGRHLGQPGVLVEVRDAHGALQGHGCLSRKALLLSREGTSSRESPRALVQ